MDAGMTLSLLTFIASIIGSVVVVAVAWGTKTATLSSHTDTIKHVQEVQADLAKRTSGLETVSVQGKAAHDSLSSHIDDLYTHHEATTARVMAVELANAESRAEMRSLVGTLMRIGSELDKTNTELSQIRRDLTMLVERTRVLGENNGRK